MKTGFALTVKETTALLALYDAQARCWHKMMAIPHSDESGFPEAFLTLQREHEAIGEKILEALREVS